ncbi:MAG: nucleotide exchange factor GrpE [Patescibacteria group bacterium]|nr:nucleotide exchange factor GrpE [Patescibacteria group bacterium]
MKKQAPQKPKKTSKNTKLVSAQEYQQQIGELTAHLQSLQAEFENYKKRQQSESSALMENAKIAVLTELLPALDNFDRAATHLPAELEENAWARGMQYVGQQMLDILDQIGVKRFEPLGQIFSHSQHDALEYVRSSEPEGTITEVIIPGYQIGERVVRPAQVRVSSGDKIEAVEDEINKIKE